MSKQILLTQDRYALVDDEDFEVLNKYKWSYSSAGKGYVQRYPGILMHRVVLNAQKNEEIDHKNGDGLDNRKLNLRKCTHAQNLRNRRRQKNNTSGYIGVSLQRKRGKKWAKWKAQIHFNQKTITLGFFSFKEEAARKYDEAAKIYFGEFAQLNF